MNEEEILKAWGLDEEPDAPDEELDEDAEEELEEQDDPEDIEDAEDGEDSGDPEEEPEPEEDHEPEDEDPFREERERLEAANRQAMAAALDAQVAGLGIVDPYNGNRPITNRAEYDAYMTAHRNARWDQIARQTGMTREQLDELIRQHPDVVAGQQLRAQMEQQQEEANRQRAEQALAADLAEISRMLPGVDSKETLVGHESWSQVKKLMEDNPKLGLKNAFRLANADAIQNAAGQKARDAARRSAAGKKHLRSAAGRGEGLPEVPADVKAIYRAWEPGITEAQMRRAYAEDMKQK